VKLSEVASGGLSTSKFDVSDLLRSVKKDYRVAVNDFIDEDGDLTLGNCKLTSLEGSPKNVPGGVYCSHNYLTDLEGCPKSVRALDAAHNRLKTLKGCPTFVQNGLILDHNNLKSFDVSEPIKLRSGIQLSNNKISSLEGIHKKIISMEGFIRLNFNPVKSHLLGVILIPGCRGLSTLSIPLKALQIINEYLNKKIGIDVYKEDLYHCQDELTEAGFEEYAKL